MSDAWRYAVWPIHGQGHEPFKVANSAIFKVLPIYNGGWQMTTDSYRAQYLQPIGAWFLIFVGVDRLVPYGLIYGHVS